MHTAGCCGETYDELDMAPTVERDGCIGVEDADLQAAAYIGSRTPAMFPSQVMFVIY